jgi:hypothetical protein
MMTSVGQEVASGRETGYGVSAYRRTANSERIVKRASSPVVHGIYAGGDARTTIPLRIAAMLTKLVMRFDPTNRVGESASGLSAPLEHEHDDEHGDE